jgi:nitrite reductase/ring-hydroxylating ferredoxin subunit
MAEFQRVAKVSEIPEGTGKTVQAGGKAIALFNAGGVFYAVSNICPHRGGPLGEGTLRDRTVTCPWHAWTFDLCTGKLATNPNVPIGVQTYPCRTEGEDVLVEC